MCKLIFEGFTSLINYIASIVIYIHQTLLRVISPYIHYHDCLIIYPKKSQFLLGFTIKEPNHILNHLKDSSQSLSKDYLFQFGHATSSFHFSEGLQNMVLIGSL
jgi:hypothetical protein